jgi:hypothetical protein
MPHREARSQSGEQEQEGQDYESPKIELMGTMHELTEAMKFSVLDISAQLGSSSSDAARKDNIEPADTADILAKVAALPVHRWNYISDGPSTQHIGPTAQDFYAAFEVGEDDHHIHPIDGYGVALAAVQELAAEVARLRAEVEELRAPAVA